MGEEHDSWIEGIGVKIDDYKAGDSVWSGVKETISSGREALQDLQNAAHDTRDAAVSYAKSKVEYVAAGDLKLVGADKTAKALEEDSKDEENAAKKKWDNAGDD